MPHMSVHCGKFVRILYHVANFIRFGTSDKMRFLVFGVPNVSNIWHLVHLAHLVDAQLHQVHLNP